MFKVFGIQLAVHASFFILLAYVGFDGWRESGVPGLLWGVGLTLLFFVCVILHELGHSLTAMQFGVRVPRILLLPIGGMAEFDHIPRKPSEELLITAAGPLVNYGIALVLYLVVGLPAGWPWHADYADTWMGLAQLLMSWNLIMGTFNLVPVFPMDGGRIFRALLATRLPYLRATWWAVVVGRSLAVVFATGAGYRHNWILCTLFIFIFFAGNAEYRYLLRHEEEEHYWAEIARRARLAGPIDGSAPLPPGIVSGSEQA